MEVDGRLMEECRRGGRADSQGVDKDRKEEQKLRGRGRKRRRRKERLQRRWQRERLEKKVAEGKGNESKGRKRSKAKGGWRIMIQKTRKLITQDGLQTSALWDKTRSF